MSDFSLKLRLKRKKLMSCNNSAKARGGGSMREAKEGEKKLR